MQLFLLLLPDGIPPRVSIAQIRVQTNFLIYFFRAKGLTKCSDRVAVTVWSTKCIIESEKSENMDSEAKK